MWLPNEITKCVAFLGIKNDHGIFFPKATGFFVSVPSELNENLHYPYFVTAKHVVVELDKKQKYYISVNNKKNESELIECDKSLKWYDHPQHEDSAADVSVLSARINIDSVDVKMIPESMFLDRNSLDDGSIGIGNEVFITGLFNRFSGKNKNMPIIRVGNIAMLPDEKISTDKFGEIDAYLIEARSIGGISGSPVFFRKPQQTDKGFSAGVNFYLGGLMHGHWETNENKIDSSSVELDFEGNKNVNMGIAIVTPIHKLREILHSAELINHRKAMDAESKK